MTSGPQTGPWPGTSVRAPSGRSTVSSTSIQPLTDPCSANGVPPLNNRSPAKTTERSPIYDDRVVRGVRRGAHVADVAAQVVRPQRDALGIGQERRGGFQVTPVHLGPDSGRRRHRGVQDPLAASFVADDGGAAHQVVAVRMVAVMMGVDQRADRFTRDRLDGVQVGAGAPFRRGGVDADHAVAAGQEAGVVQVPAAVRLQVGVDVLAHLADFAQAHRRAPLSGTAAAATPRTASRRPPARREYRRYPGSAPGRASDTR